MNKLNIINWIVPVSQYTRPGLPMQSVDAVVLHWIGNPNTTAKNNRDYMAIIPEINKTSGKAPIYASWHYTIGLDGEIIQQIPENEIAYHAGGLHYTETAKKLFWDDKRKSVYPHDKCIGIEICHPGLSGKFNQKTYDSAVELAAEIVFKYKLSRDQILRHYDVTGKICPKWFVEHPDEWESMRDDIMQGSVELKKI